MPIRIWGVNMPTRAELPALPKGIVLHWTGGGPYANDVDLKAYHYVVEQNGRVRPGFYPVSANMRNLDDPEYAHHTGGMNSFRVGISACGMMGYQSPQSPGRHPLTVLQVETMCEVAGYFAWVGGLDPMKPSSVCTHQEVWTKLYVKGATNHTKKDIEYLPFNPALEPHEVGDYLRMRAAKYVLEVLDPFTYRELPILKRGSRGKDVARLQEILGVRGPDVFGPLTEASVKDFQKKNGLAADGIVGQKTWRALLAAERR